MPATIKAVGQPVNDSERNAIKALRDGLPDGYFVIHNFEIRANRQFYEIDIAIIAPHCVYLVDVKSTRGQIDVFSGKWYPENRMTIPSPLMKLRNHAKVLKSLICDAHPTRPELKKMYVHAAVILTAPDAKLINPSGSERDDVTDLANCARYFQNKRIIPPYFASDIRQFHSLILNTLNPQMKPKRMVERFGDWEIEEKLGGTESYTDYRARRAAGSMGGNLKSRLRVYTIDPYQETDVRETERKLISNAYRALLRMSGHPNILNVREYLEYEDDGKSVLVTEDVTGHPLSQHIRKHELALTFDQKLSIIRGVLSAFEHSHRSGVIHRNLTPDAILIGADGQPRLSEFDYARSGATTSTIAGHIAEEFDTPYLAPECYRDPIEASPRSDLYSAGAVFYELLTGQAPFASFDQMLEYDAVFPQRASEIQGDLPKALDGWLQMLCSFKREDRYQSAMEALAELERALASAGSAKEPMPEEISQSNHQQPAQFDYNDLKEEFVLNGRYIVRKKLGGGGFAVAYKVLDSWGEVERVMKIVLRDRISQFDRFKKEYQTLLSLQNNPHPHVVKLIHGDTLPDGTFYILFDFLEGLTVEKCIEDKSLSLEDAYQIVKETAEGLSHLHEHGIYHHDIKPSNLLWTEHGVKIFDFNVATTASNTGAAGGGTRRYLPPDFHADDEQTPAEQMDRDLYALGLTFYQCVTGRYPFDTSTPPLRQAPRDPREFESSRDLSPNLAQLMLKMIAPTRAERFTSAARLIEGLQGVGNLRRLPEPEPAIGDTLPTLKGGWASDRLNYNPFVTDLLTLYSQSRRSNTGTRGLDRIGAATYVPTLLDTQLREETLGGKFKLVIISGNAGDGKTAFIQKLEKRAEIGNAQVERGANGASFMYLGRRFYSNYDGSQDEGEKVNDEVLSEFLAPFAGNNEATWPDDETRLIAINEGRLIDFLSERERQFPRLLELVRNGLRGGETAAGVAVINLNLRAVVADAGGKTGSIFDRLVRKMTEADFWQACGNCDLRDRCYVHHNYRTLTDPVAGPKVIERLKTLYTITHLRERLHITLRDLRSALAFTIAGTRDCDEIHLLYSSTGEETRQQILDGFYFNSWLGGADGSADRLLRLLSEIDVGQAPDPELDRRLDFLEPKAGELNRFGFADRGKYDDELLSKLFRDLKRGYVAEGEAAQAMEAHRSYVAMMRRREYFERRDERWREMTPYRGAERFMALVLGGGDMDEEQARLLLAINRGEGVTRPDLLDHSLALRVREVRGGTIRSYRLFDGERFALERVDGKSALRFVEHLPQSLKLVYKLGGQRPAELNVTLDIYEMLTRLNEGYRPSNEEKQGLYLRLAVFKNTLAAAPYQEVLLTETGHEFYRITRAESGALTMVQVKGDSTDAAKEE